MKTKNVNRRRGASLTGVLGMLALVGAIVCVCLGMQEQGRTARPDAEPVSLAGAPVDQTVPIEQIRVGRRVLAGNPEMTAGQLDQISEIVPDQWRKVALEMTKPDGGRLDIVLLRPTSWLLASGAQTGDEIHLDMPELGAVGPAKVVSIQPCPQILPGGGRVVTGTFAHRAGNVVDLTIEGASDPIGTTTNHPFWSEDRQAFVPAGELRPDELLRTLAGYAHVVSVIPRAGPEAVYNIEVHGEHVYHVGVGGVLVHNAYANYTDQSRRHVSSHGHSANQQPVRQSNGQYKSRFRPTEGGQKFTNEVMNHRNVQIAHQSNGRVVYTVRDLGRTTGYNQQNLPTRGGTVVVEGRNPASWSTYVPNEVVTQFPK